MAAARALGLRGRGYARGESCQSDFSIPTDTLAPCRMRPMIRVEDFGWKHMFFTLHVLPIKMNLRGASKSKISTRPLRPGLSLQFRLCSGLERSYSKTPNYHP